MSFGTLKSALIKLAAIALVPDAIYILLLVMGVEVGGYGLYAILLVTYYTLFMTLFELEFLEARKLVFAIWAIRTFVAIGLTAALR